jgi:ribosomal protein S18 acetylase RimI-like enzyme
MRAQLSHLYSRWRRDGRPVEPSDPLLAAALACADYFYARMFRDWPDAVTRTVGGCTFSFSGDTQLTGANHLWPHTPDALTVGALREAAVFFAPFHAAWSAICTDTFMPRAVDLLAEYDYSPRWQSPLMVLDGPAHDGPANPSARVVRVTTGQHLEHVGLVMSESFATGHSVNQRVVRSEHLADPAIRHYLVYDGEEPATCASVVVSGGMAGVWNVGTRRRFRRHGYAATIMLALLDDLRSQGITASMLMASPSGQPLYERLGYRHAGTTLYMRPPQLMRARCVY